jgi:hypothetical protein
MAFSFDDEIPASRGAWRDHRSDSGFDEAFLCRWGQDSTGRFFSARLPWHKGEKAGALKK